MPAVLTSEQILNLLEDVIDGLERPTVTNLDTGFRHTALTPAEKIERLLDTCAVSKDILMMILPELRRMFEEFGDVRKRQT